MESIKKNVISNPAFVFEIGAFDGSDIPVIQSVWPGALVHAFEPDPDNYAKAKAFESQTAFVKQIALSNKSGPTTFYQVWDCRMEDRQEDRHWWFKTAGSLHPNGDPHKSLQPTLVDHPITVQATTLNDYCGETLRPDILLIDTQGCEYEILEGASAILPKVTAVQFEWSKIEVYQGIKFYDDIVKLLEGYGFKFFSNRLCWGQHHGESVWIKK